MFVLPARSGAIGFDALSSGPVSIASYSALRNVPRGGTVRIALELDIRSPWHVNAHKLDDEYLVPTTVAFTPPEGVKITRVIYPAGHRKKLEISDSEMNLYDGTVWIGAVVSVAPEVKLGSLTIPANVTYQACDNHKCLMPTSKKVYVALTVSKKHEAVDVTHDEIFSKIAFPPSGAATTTDGTPGQPATGGVAESLLSHGLFLALVLVFLGGLGLNLTPCVFPIIPITVSYFGGQSRGNNRHTVILAFLYLLGMATMYSALGVFAASTGSLFGSALQNPLVNVFIAVVMVVLAMSMFGFYEIRVPARLAGVAGTAKQGAAGAFAMGLTVGIVAAPCIGPFVLGLLTFVGERGDPALGFLMFFTLALGLGTPYVVLAMASGNISRLPRSGEWMDWVRRLFGVALVAMAVYFLNPVLGDTPYYLLLGATLIIGGIAMGFFVSAGSSVLFVSVLRRVVGVAIPVLGLYLILAPGNIRSGAHTAGIAWQPYNESVIAAARTAHRPVVIDFAAEWCLPCQELDRKTFTDPRVVHAAGAIIALRADLTHSSSPPVKALREKYKIRGVPTLVFIDSSGHERGDLRVVQFIHANEFLHRLEQLGSPSRPVDGNTRAQANGSPPR